MIDNELPINVYDKKIKTICSRFANQHKQNKIEYDDLYQEAYIKLLQLDTNKPEEYILRCIVNHLINYIHKWNNDPLSTAISIEDLL